MSQVESCRDRQTNEFEVLKSIFGDELTDLRKNKQRRRWQPMEISMTLTPQQGMSGPAEVYAQIDLHIVCGENYPDTPPSIEFNNSRGLSNQQIAVLCSEIEKLSEKLKGEVMIFELAQHVQKFLHEHNKPGYSSFYEEMVSRQQEKIQTEMQEKQLKEDKERQVLQDEIQKRQEALKAEIRERRESIRLSNGSNISLTTPSSPHERMRTYSRRRCMSSADLVGHLCEHDGVKLLQFDNNWGERQVHRGKCLGHSQKGSNVYAGVDKITGELVAVTEWFLKCGTVGNSDVTNETSDLQNSLKQIGSIEQELNHLQRLQHPNLVRYMNMKYIQNDDSIVIYIVQEFVVGTTCSFLLAENLPVYVEILRHIADGVLAALEFLHNNNIVHKDLRDSSIHLDRQGVVKVSDYSLNKRLSDIYHSSCLAKADQDFPTIQGRGGKKLDIYRFGILILSLSKGEIISEKETEWGANLQPELRDFLSKCLNSDERARWSAEQLQQHSFIRTPLDRGITPPKPHKDSAENSSEPEETAHDIHMYLSALGGQSRIQNEFEVLKWLGKGAFGDVIKAKNKLDGGIYAIKRIRLNAKTKQLNKKITREVKLLSRLSHENVVRYYNSWIENATLDDSGSNSTTTTTSPSKTQKTTDITDGLKIDMENLVSTIPEVEWNLSYSSRASAISADSEDDESDSSSDGDSDVNWGFLRRTNNDSSDSIEFEKDETSQTTSEQNSMEEVSRDIDEDKNECELKKEIQFMYIQMEFCEKSTLRTAIDNGLYEDEERVWRLFREMVEGLAHIHQQGMIHRDLKPVNIFLDSNDHVKIGDFGLATTNILSSLRHPVDQDREIQLVEKTMSFDPDEPLNSMTGQVGTALYTAPELSSKAAKAIYNQKVDIYSLGIMLFEMCYKPMTTGMERVKVLMNVRNKDIILPSEINENDTPNQVKLFNLLLNHDPSQRPTSQELLSSEFLPPPPLEEAELQEMISHTLSNSQSKAYKYLIASCFDQKVTPAEDITYDMNLPSRNNTNIITASSEFIRQYVKSKVVEIFQRHGGIEIATPLLMPKCGHLYNEIESCVRLMTRSGNVVSIPHDLRAPFARYIAWNNILHHRRYAIERVYREKKVNGFHPRELYECAFDIVSPTLNLMAEGELIYIAYEIFEKFPELRDKNFTVRVNHTSLLLAVLVYCGIEPEKYQDIYTILCDARNGKVSKFQVQTHLISLCLTDQAMSMLFNLFEIESSASKITSVLKSITKRKGDAAILATEGLREIEIVIANAEALGVKYPIIIAPLLVPNTQEYSGIFYQITCELKRRRRRCVYDVIAAGGRYDKMLTAFRQVLERGGLANQGIRQHAVGISISFDRLVSAVSEINAEYSDINTTKFGIDIVVCCTDGIPKRERELADVLRELWTLGLRVATLDLSTTDEIIDYCRENSITHAVMLKSGEKGNLRIQSWERDRYQERKITMTDIAEQFQRQQNDNPPPILNRSESKVNTTYDCNAPVNVNIRFVLLPTNKISGSVRRSYKNAMMAQMTPILQRISPKVPIEVFAVSLDMTVIRTIASHLEIDGEEQDCEKSIQLIIEKHLRHKKYIKQICDEMSEARNEKLHPTLIIYSLVDNRYVTLI